MKAVRIHKQGGPDVLKYESTADPKCGPKEVLIEVKACALNHLDIWTRKGLSGIKTPLPIIPGSDVSGVVASTGKLAKGMKPGDKVVLAPATSCGQCQACLGGQDNLCMEYRILGFHRDGGCADFISVPEANVIPMPKAMTFVDAASVPLVFMTAWHMVVTRARVQPGEDVLILAAGSGVGSAAIQVAKLFGARVIATASTQEKLAKALALGADDVINYAKKDFRAEVMRLTDKRGVDVIVEHVGPATWEKCILSLAKNGRLVTCGATTGPFVKLDLRYLFSRQLSLLGSFMGSKAELIEVLKYFPQKKLQPVVDYVYAMKDVATAHRRMEDRKQFGKIVLTPSAGASAARTRKKGSRGKRK